MDRIAGILCAAALILPPASAQPTSITLAACGDLPPATIEIPAKRKSPGKGHDCCKKACHAATDRKKKNDDDDNCC